MSADEWRQLVARNDARLAAARAARRQLVRDWAIALTFSLAFTTVMVLAYWAGQR